MLPFIYQIVHDSSSSSSSPLGFPTSSTLSPQRTSFTVNSSRYSFPSLNTIHRHLPLHGGPNRTSPYLSNIRKRYRVILHYSPTLTFFCVNSVSCLHRLFHPEPLMDYSRSSTPVLRPSFLLRPKIGIIRSSSHYGNRYS